MGKLTQLATVKEYLGITDTASDTLINNLIDRASEFMETFCGRKFGEASYTEYHDGDGIASKLFLRQWPIISSLTSLHDDTNRTYGSASLVNTDDYVATNETGIIALDGLRFHVGVANVKAVYSAGYKLPGGTGSGSPLPLDLEQACIELVALRWNDRGKERLGKTSQAMGDGGTESYVQDLPWQIRLILERYRKARV